MPLEEDHHLRRVLRAGPGDRLEVVGSGRLYRAELLEGDLVRVLERLEVAPESSVVTLYQAVPKGKRMESVVEKAVEMGVSRIVPLLTDRGVVNPGEKGSKNERWRRISESAARQSLQLRIPEVGAPEDLTTALDTCPEASRLFFHNSPEAEPLESLTLSSPAAIFIGPEGGWSERELSLAREEGVYIPHLGPSRLRAETAGMVAVCRVKALLGDYSRI